MKSSLYLKNCALKLIFSPLSGPLWSVDTLSGHLKSTNFKKEHRVFNNKTCYACSSSSKTGVKKKIIFTGIFAPTVERPWQHWSWSKYTVFYRQKLRRELACLCVFNNLPYNLISKWVWIRISLRENIVQNISSQLQKKKQRRQTEEYWSNPLLVVSRVNADH